MVETSKGGIKTGSTPTTFEGFSEIRKTKKGLVESADVKAKFNLAEDKPVNHITCNQPQNRFAVATNIGFEII
jgi:hypothetical protein